MKVNLNCRVTAVLFSFLAAAASAAPLPVPPVAGDIYVSASPLLVKINADGTQTTLPFAILMPSGLVVDAQGNLFVADATTNSVIKVAPDGSETTVATGLSNPTDLALNASGALFIADSGTNSIIKVSPNGTQTTLATGLNNPSGLAFDQLGNLLVSEKGANAIVKVSPDGTKTDFVTTGLNAPGGLAADANGNILVADTGSDSILSIDRNGNVTTKVGTGLNNPTDVALDNLGNLLVTDTGSNSILKVAPDGTTSTVTNGLLAPQFIAMAPGLHQFLDISTRGFVGTGSQVLIGGFIVRGVPGAAVGQSDVLVRAIGPSLDPALVAGRLINPMLELHDGSGAIIATNNNWMDTQKAQIMATGLAPRDARESAIRATLPDGNYTAIVSGLDGTTGVGLVEVYKLDDNL